MRISVSTAVLGVLAVLAFQPAAWGQFSTGNQGTSASRATGSRGAQGPGGGATPSMGTGVSDLSGSDRFVRESRQPGEFVGADTGESREFVGDVNAGAAGSRSTRQQFSQRTAASRRQSAQTANRGRTSSRATAEIRTGVKVAFSYQKPAPNGLTPTLARSLQRTDLLTGRSPVEVSIAGGRATLRGEVATKYDRSLAEQLVRLEPGIWRVENQLTVVEEKMSAPPGASAPTTPPSGSSPSQ